MVKNKSIITLLLLLIAITGFTQPAKLYFNHLTTENGLSQGVVTNILTDKKGFTWFTTYDGINRFDGTTCISNRQIGPGLEGIGETRGIVEDNNGDIWFGSIEALIQYSYKTNRFEKLTINPVEVGHSKNKIPTYNPVAVHKDNLLISVGDTALVVYNIYTHKSIRLETALNVELDSVDGMSVLPVAGDFKRQLMQVKRPGNHDIYYFFRLVADKTGQYRWLTNKITSKQFDWNSQSKFSQNDSILIMADRNNAIWQYNYAANKLEKIFQFQLKAGGIDGLYAEGNQRLWIGTGKDGLYVYDLVTKKAAQNYRHDDASAVSLMGNQTNTFKINNDMLWVSSWGKGIDYCRLTDNCFSHHFTNEEALANKTNNFIRDMAEGIDGNFYCNTQYGGVVQLDKQLKFIKTISLKYSNGLGIDETKTNLYFGKSDLVKYNLLSNTTTNLFNPASKEQRNGGAEDYYHFSQLKNGNTLAASMNGLWIIDKKKNNITELPGLNSESTSYSIFGYEGRNGNIYKYSLAHGLQVFQLAEGRYKAVFTFPEKFTAKYIYDENDSTAWIATTNGLYVFNPQNLKIKNHFTVDDGLPNNVIYAVAPDNFGRLWFSTNKGISMFTKATGRFKNYSGTSGMQGNEYNTHTVVTASDGRIIFGGVNGLTAIRPWEIKNETTTPIIQFTAIKADSSINPFQFNEADNNILHLAAGSNALELSFVAIEYNNPGACQLKYKLIGYDDDWVLSKNPGNARYVQLKPGSYTFEIMVANADGVWSKEIKHLQVKINAAWWQQLWFKLLIIFLSILTILLAIRQYIKQKLYRQRMQMEKQQAIVQERERIIADLHDDVGATLSSMHIYGDLAREAWESKPEESKNMVGKITTQAKDLMNRMGDIVWSLKPVGEEKNTLTDRLKNYSNELLASKNIECQFTINEALSSQITNPATRKNMLLIAKEAMNNIAKYSGTTTAIITLRQQKDEVLLEIKDNGKGFDNLTQQAGNGLQNMKQRCELLKGKFVINTSSGKGTHITCVFPIAIISHTG